jgi:hypothetical protein
MSTYREDLATERSWWEKTPRFMIRIQPHPYYRRFSALESGAGDVADPKTFADQLRKMADSIEQNWPNGFPEETEGPSYESAS